MTNVPGGTGDRPPASDDAVDRDAGALLDEAEKAWKRLAADDAALAAYRNETAELASFDAPLRVY